MEQDSYRNRGVLVTGGAGFIGSSLVHELVRRGGSVTVVDSFHPDYGGNEYNFSGIADRIRLVRGNITDQPLMRELVDQAEIVFHVAAQCSHVDSMVDPWLDLDYNCRGTLSVLEAARQSRRNPVVVYAGTRAMIGAPLQLPATESTLPNPVDVYGVNKLAAELYGSVYARVHRIPFVSLRLTNSYGSRHQMKSGKYGILNWFISLALQGKPVKVFGTGEQLRDYLYIDDAVEAFSRAGRFALDLREGRAKCARAQLAGEKIPYAVFNIGSGKGIRFVDCARKIIERAGTPLELVPWPADRAAIETGDFVSDGTAAREGLGWSPVTGFDDGLDRTFAFYRDHLRHYL